MRTERGIGHGAVPPRAPAPRRLLSAAAALLPSETRTHARASVREGFAALRSLADGSSELTERAIDRITALLGKH
jgi:hypothetical protein